MQGCITKRTPPLSHTVARYPKAKLYHSNPREHKLPGTTEGPLELLLLMLSFGRERGGNAPGFDSGQQHSPSAQQRVRSN